MSFRGSGCPDCVKVQNSSSHEPRLQPPRRRIAPGIRGKRVKNAKRCSGGKQPFHRGAAYARNRFRAQGETLRFRKFIYLGRHGHAQPPNQMHFLWCETVQITVQSRVPSDGMNSRCSYHRYRGPRPSSQPSTRARVWPTWIILPPGKSIRQPSSISQIAPTDPAAIACRWPSRSRRITKRPTRCPSVRSVVMGGPLNGCGEPRLSRGRSL